MYRIFDTDDATFATQVARVTTYEWFVFKDLFMKKWEEEDREHPYERIKPSQRKAYQRNQIKYVEQIEGSLENKWVSQIFIVKFFNKKIFFAFFFYLFKFLLKIIPK